MTLPIVEISSRSNPIIKWARSLLQPKKRRQLHLFIAEGVRLLEEAREIPAHTLIMCPELTRQNARANELYLALAKLSDRIFHVSQHVLECISETKTSQGLIAIFPIRIIPTQRPPNFSLILDNIQNPGNLGTILRTARASNVDQVHITPGSVDTFSPKVVRSAMGAHFHLPITPFSGWSSIHPDNQILVADVKRGHNYQEIDWTKKSALILGSEAHGLRTPLPVDRRIKQVKIPMAPGAESLNVAVAAGALLMHAFQARSKPEINRNPQLDVQAQA